MGNTHRKGPIGLGIAAIGAALVIGLTAAPVQAQDGRWCQKNPDRCARLKDRIRTRCQQDPAWCARLRDRMRQRRAARRSGQGSDSGRLIRQTIRHGGMDREYWWAKPTDAGRKVPLVVVLHGGGGRALQVARYTGFVDQAIKSRFAVMFPQGVKRRWNDGRRVNRSPKTDDVGFLRAAVQRILRKNRQIESRRVFFTGISNGGFMSMRIACDASDLVAGVAAVTAQFNGPLSRRCTAARPVPVLMMNGTADPLVPYNGGSVGGRFFSRGVAASTDATAAFWRRRNGCATQGTVTRLPDVDKSDGVTTVRTAWTACQTGAPVVLYKLIGGGHTWPGKRPYLPVRVIGRSSRDMDGTAVIWRFFASLPARR